MKTEIEAAYDDAMDASNELGYACMSAGDVIRHQGDELVCFRRLLAAAECYLNFRHMSDCGLGEEYSGVHPETELREAIARVKGEAKDGN